jgi:hypothetical protein
MSGSGLIRAALDLPRSATSERADTLAWLDAKIAACRRAGEPAEDSLRRFAVARDEIAAGLHERDDYGPLHEAPRERAQNAPNRAGGVA